MNKLFNLDNPFFSFMSRAADLMVLSILWIVCCLPVVTAGASTVALYYVTLKMAKNEESMIVKSFFHAFRQNLKQGIYLFLIFLAGGIICAFDFFFMSKVDSFFGAVTQALFLVLGICFTTMMLFAFPLQAQFENTIRGTLKNAFILAFQKVRNMGCILGLNLLPTVLLFLPLQLFLKLLPVMIAFVPATIAYLCSVQFKKIFEPLVSTKENKHD